MLEKKERFNMSEEKLETQVEETVEEVVEETAEVAETEENVEQLPARKQRGRKKKVETREEKPESEWKEQVVQIRRVTKVVKNLITVPIFKTTIPHPITGRSGAGAVMLRPASQGTGIIAGGAVRSVLELAGIENILSKSLGSKSPLNAANATLEALKSLRPFNEAAKKRGLTMAELLN